MAKALSLHKGWLMGVFSYFSCIHQILYAGTILFKKWGKGRAVSEGQGQGLLQHRKAQAAAFKGAALAGTLSSGEGGRLCSLCAHPSGPLFFSAKESSGFIPKVSRNPLISRKLGVYPSPRG